ncbi:hypothetical protein RclHR1_03380007 [Rhizophagus clarus]|uniref:Uncharacterized protein n=1 Tax=Rhizophagus clarus TaxID=94130 RepID=A0A2Z6R9I0_9GLOM|nr:hypothetical protein RclHR1_03380007 [Rhizophagus clarus]
MALQLRKREIRNTIQGTGERHSIWAGRNYDSSAALSTDFNNYCVGCGFPTMEAPHPSPCQKNIIKEPEDSFEGQNFNDGGGYIESSDNCQFNVFYGKTTTKEKESETKKEYNEIHVRCFNSMRESINDDKRDDINKQQSGSEIKGEVDTSVKLVQFEYCSNRSRVFEMQTSLGELLRDDTVACTIQKSDLSKRTCNFVKPVHQNERHDDNRSVYKVSVDYENNERYGISDKNHLMVVEQFKNESDCYNIATSFGSVIINNDIEYLTSDIEIVKQYGFNHIISIGMRPHGFLFMDCYGRVFDWDDMSGLLWPLGYYSKVPESMINWTGWGVESNGTIVEIKAGKCVFFFNLKYVHSLSFLSTS